MRPLPSLAVPRSVLRAACDHQAHQPRPGQRAAAHRTRAAAPPKGARAQEGGAGAAAVSAAGPSQGGAAGGGGCGQAPAHHAVRQGPRGHERCPVGTVHRNQAGAGGMGNTTGAIGGL